MDRKFSTSRTYNLIKLIVNIITILAILSAASITINKKNNFDLEDKVFNDCMRGYPDQTIREFCTNTWLIGRDSYNKNQDIAIYTAILLPLIFYGGTALFNYLFPRERASFEQSKQDRELQTNYEWENQRIEEHLTQSEDKSNVNPEILKPKF